MSEPRATNHATSTLIRSARRAYAQSIGAQLDAIGIDDLPRNGALILGGIHATGTPRQDLPAELGVTKQAVSQAIDKLVNRGYLNRRPDPGDRRRIALELTERGQQAVEAAARGMEAVDRQLEERVSPEQIHAMRSALIAITEIEADAVATGAGRRRPARRFRRISPIFPVRDLGAALAHYAALGFRTFAYEDGDDYGFADRDRVGLHLAADPAHDVARAASAYLRVRDADALYEEWSKPGIGGRTYPVAPTPYKLREGSHVDPDGNLIRFGSAIDA
jgi:DNA-binding MarR family transcriptional regulator